MIALLSNAFQYAFGEITEMLKMKSLIIETNQTKYAFKKRFVRLKVRLVGST